MIPPDMDRFPNSCSITLHSSTTTTTLWEIHNRDSLSCRSCKLWRTWETQKLESGYNHTARNDKKDFWDASRISFYCSPLHPRCQKGKTDRGYSEKREEAGSKMAEKRGWWWWLQNKTSGDMMRIEKFVRGRVGREEDREGLLLFAY